jgi:hypothetical protein
VDEFQGVVAFICLLFAFIVLGASGFFNDMLKDDNHKADKDDDKYNF